MEDWMSKLTPSKRNKPLINLAIPGSHHSASCYLKETAEIAPDQPWCVQVLNSNEIIRKAVYNWSKLQKLTITEQLEAGVRYFDLSVAYIRDTFAIVNGLYCCDIRDLLVEIEKFSNRHLKEIVLIDIKHFYRFEEGHHEKLLELLDTMLGDKLINQPETSEDLAELTLNKIWSTPGRVIVFYQMNNSIVAENVNCRTTRAGCSRPQTSVWNKHITNPWPKTEDVSKMIEETAGIIRDRDGDAGFQACCAIVTLTVTSVMRQLTGIFEMRYARRATRSLVKWLGEKEHENRSNINIIATDFIDESNFCKVIIELNR